MVCVAEMVNEEIYRTRHVEQECACLHFHSPAVQADIEHIVDEGGIPVVSVCEDDPNISLLVGDASPIAGLDNAVSDWKTHKPPQHTHCSKTRGANYTSKFPALRCYLTRMV